MLKISGVIFDVLDSDPSSPVDGTIWFRNTGEVKAQRSGSTEILCVLGDEVIQSVAGKTGVVVLSKSDVGLGSVDNTSDANKPVSTSTQTSLDAKVDDSEKGSANGVATLDGSGKVPTSQLNLTSLDYQGVWNASTNTPALSDSGGGGVQGDFYKVSIAGSTSVDGETDWNIGDWIVNNGTIWEKADHSDSVSSVASKTGAIVLVAADITDFDTEVGNHSDVAANTADRHTHSNQTELDKVTDGDHDVRTDNPHGVTKTQVGLGNVADLKVNLVATTNPGVSDDDASGYAIGSTWINTTTKEEFSCMDASTGAADWKSTTSQGSGSVAYAEKFGAIVQNTTADTWQAKTLTGATANTIVDVCIHNLSSVTKIAGVRKVGSTIERKFSIERTDFIVKVLTDESGQAELFSDDISNLEFRLVGELT